MDLLQELAPLSEAEEKLLAECAGISRLSVGDGTLPSEARPDCEIRARLLRALLLDELPEHRLNDKGVRLRGAWVSGPLDLQGTDCSRDISLSQCRLEGGLQLVNAALRGVHIAGSVLGGIAADNAVFSGSVYIRGKSVVSGEIVLAGARITGDLQICDAEIHSDTSDAVFAPSLRVEGSVFLGNYPYSDVATDLTCDGMLFFSSAQIDHDFFISSVAVSVGVDPVSGFFDPTEEHGADMAISLARARVGGLLLFQDSQIARGIVNLAGAQVGRFKDEPVGPGAAYPIRLDGFQYGDFSRHADTGIKTRLSWLARRPSDTPFTAQPYEQLAYVLKRIGHRTDARTVLMHKERLLREASREAAPLWWQPVRWLFDGFLRATIGYGYRPVRAVMIAVAMVLFLGWMFDRTWHAGDMAPNAAPILTSGPWISATIEHADNPGAYWAQPGQAGQDWETFNAFAYAADLVIPIVNLGQEDAWAPSTSRSDWGRAAWWMRWFAKAIGWIVTALGAAAITGVIRND